MSTRRERKCGLPFIPIRETQHGKPYSVITVDWPEMSNRLRQRRFLHAIMSSLRTMYDRNLAKRARSRSSARPASWRLFVRTTQVTSYSAAWWQWGQFKVAGFLSVRSSKKSRSSMRSSPVASLGRLPVQVSQPRAGRFNREESLLQFSSGQSYGNMDHGYPRKWRARKR